MLLLETGRLWLRTLSEADIEAIHELHSLQETDEFNTLGIPDNIQVTRNVVGDCLLREGVAYPRAMGYAILEEDFFLKRTIVKAQLEDKGYLLSMMYSALPKRRASLL